MENVVLTIHLLLALALVGVVLLQRSEGGGLGLGGGGGAGGGVMSGRSAASALSKVTNPNPRERPESRSLITRASTTTPTGAKNSFNASPSTDQDKFPTKSRNLKPPVWGIVTSS